MVTHDKVSRYRCQPIAAPHYAHHNKYLISTFTEIKQGELTVEGEPPKRLRRGVGCSRSDNVVLSITDVGFEGYRETDPWGRLRAKLLAAAEL
jgi:hypothetical protein